MELDGLAGGLVGCYSLKVTAVVFESKEDVILPQAPRRRLVHIFRDCLKHESGQTEMQIIKQQVQIHGGECFLLFKAPKIDISTLF